ncbi:hypothetical protein SacN8_01635 [Sulfolobus acidocaldarius N8]|uniref:DUF1641 domain-containing protein n=1 Tax=Sulfolobus acidocaldarius N8 TaxID=1028566 RepID=M1I1X3_9CREN|nr:hypothetical protein SacN8_01635 [Sulfolobus acidocaldarius N8]
MKVMQDLNLDKIFSKLDQKRIDALSELVELTPTLTELLKKLDELKESGTLDALINYAYIGKTMKDMLNDDALQNLSNTVSSLLELTKVLSRPDTFHNTMRLMNNIDALADVTSKLRTMKEDGTLDVLMNTAYTIRTFRDMLNDEALANISRYTSNLLEILREMDDNSVRSLKSILRRAKTIDGLMVRLEELENSGALDVLLNLAYAGKTMKDMLNDDALAEIGKYLSQFLEAYPRVMGLLNSVTDGNGLVSRMMNAMKSEDVRKALESPPKVSISGLIKQLSDPEVQVGLGVLFSVIKAIGKEFSSHNK